MIKSDYKPHKLTKPIFSRKKFPLAPIILVFISLGFIFWGLISTLFSSDSAHIKSIKLEEVSIDEASEPLRNEPPVPATAKKKTFEIPLNLPDEHMVNTVSQDQAGSPPVERAGLNWQTTRIKSGDSTALLFSRHDLSATDLFNIMAVGKKTDILKRVQAGHTFEYALNQNKELVGIRYHIDQLNTLEVLRDGDIWQAQTHTKPVEVRQASAAGTIESSLFLAGKKAGMSDSLVMELAGIFGWDIDFILDIREGDQFTLVYEEKYVEGEKYANGDILVAEFVNQGKAYRAVRYTDSAGNAEYYDPKGLSMRKAFLRAPVDFSYISSKFNPKRYHPILRRVKAHNGVDYRAPKGTPVKSAGDGKVIASAYNKYNGHYVFIQHGQKYVTKYLHFTKRAVKKGQRVKQGQIIGYVGATGLAEAPHLHYEFLVNGVHRNPRTVKLPDAEPVAKLERQRFFAHAGPLFELLDRHSNLSQIKVANAD